MKLILITLGLAISSSANADLIKTKPLYLLETESLVKIKKKEKLNCIGKTPAKKRKLRRKKPIKKKLPECKMVETRFVEMLPQETLLPSKFDPRWDMDIPAPRDTPINTYTVESSGYTSYSDGFRQIPPWVVVDAGQDVGTVSSVPLAPSSLFFLSGLLAFRRFKK